MLVVVVLIVPIPSVVVEAFVAGLFEPVAAGLADRGAAGLVFVVGGDVPIEARSRAPLCW